MEGREDRRDRTVRYGERARREHLRRVHPDGALDCVCERSAWFFAKRKSVGCNCRRRGRSCSPKIANGLCHGAGGQYHPCVEERIRGRRLCRQWVAELRGSAPDDVTL